MMRLMQSSLATTARRAISSPRWICASYHGIRLLATHATAAHATALSPASQLLRSKGPARTRFAPSPTGVLHLGSLRTALFNYLVAKATGGQFVLRIEDTDQKRTIKGAEESLYEDLEWAGLEWDEGPKVGGPHGPYHQSQRTAIYQEYAKKLLQSGRAYRCFCTPERLNTLAQHRSLLGLPPDYDRTCAHIPEEESDDRASHGESHVIRFKAPDKYPIYHDLVYGLVKQRRPINDPGESHDDAILLKSDGFPTYHLANVVDDHLMKITTVIRGSEWMSSTHKHLAMYEAFGWEPPKYAHVGLLLDQQKQKLSKRAGAVHIKEWRDMGIFPETLLNFLALLGWSHNQKNDVMDMGELIRQASMKYTKGDTIVGFQKLNFLQKRHADRYATLPPNLPKTPKQDLRELAVRPMLKILENLSSDNLLSTYQRVGLRAAPLSASISASDVTNRPTAINDIQDQLTVAIDSYEVTIKERDTAISELQVQIEALETAPAGFATRRDEQLKVLREQVAGLLTEDPQLLEKLDSLEEQQNQMADVTGLREQLHVETRSYEVRIIERDATIGQIETQLSNLETAIAEDITERHAKTQDLRKQLNALSNEHTALLEQLIALEEQHNQLFEEPSTKNLSGPSREEYIHSIVLADAHNYTNPNDFIFHSRYFFRPPSQEELRSPNIISQTLSLIEAAAPNVYLSHGSPYFFELFHKITEIPSSEWTDVVLREKTREVVKEGASKALSSMEIKGKSETLKWSKLVHAYLRWAIAAGQPGPDMVDTMVILGKEETVRRLRLAEGIIKPHCKVSWLEQASLSDFAGEGAMATV